MFPHTAAPHLPYRLDALTPKLGNNQQKEKTMPLILWLLGVPLSIVLLLWLLGIV